MVYYEDLIRNLPAHVTRLAAFLRVPLSEKKLATVVEAAGFDVEIACNEESVASIEDDLEFVTCIALLDPERPAVNKAVEVSALAAILG